MRVQPAQGKYEKEALDNIKDAITAWIWAEDQKAAGTIKKRRESASIVVAVR